MPIYLVERTLGVTSMETLERLRQKTEEACRTAVGRTTPTRYLRSTFALGQSRCLCLFEAPSAELVRDVNDAAGFGYDRIVLAVDLGAAGGVKA